MLGDMKELGRDELSLHREVGRYGREKGIDLLIAAGELSAATAEGFGEGAVHFDTVDECIAALDGLLKGGDNVLVKASHSMKFERIVEALTS